MLARRNNLTIIGRMLIFYEVIMRTVFFSICFAALIPLNALAVNDLGNNNSKENDTAKHSDAIQIILQDHKQIKQKIGQLEKDLSSKNDKNHSSFQDLKSLLEKHETM